MNILLFGATGMVGDGVLRCLIASPKVNRVIAVSRKPLSVQHAKLETVIEPDMIRLQHLDALRAVHTAQLSRAQIGRQVTGHLNGTSGLRMQRHDP